MRYAIVVTNPARKQLLKLPQMIQKRVEDAIEGLADDPRPHGVEPLKGLTDTFRVRVGDYRIIYTLHDNMMLILVIRIGHRRDIYRHL